MGFFPLLWLRGRWFWMHGVVEGLSQVKVPKVGRYQR